MANTNVIVKDPSRVPVQQCLSIRERESLSQSLGAHRDILDAQDSEGRIAVEGAVPIKYPGLRVNKPKMTEQAKQIKATLERGTPQPTRPEERDALSKRAKELEVRFGHILETRAELRVKRRDDARWDSSMQKARQRPEFESEIKEWQHIQRRLDPENPDADSLHKLRRDS
jgi:hypothetical protein